MKFSRNQRGFTLIELLMVIAIIGFLASVVLVAVDNARIKARDSRRISDIKQLQNAIEIYATNNGGVYPSASNSYVKDIQGLTPTYISSLPEDPVHNVGVDGYRYRYALTNNSALPASSEYLIVVLLEKNQQAGVGQCKIYAPLHNPSQSAVYSAWDYLPKCF